MPHTKAFLKDFHAASVILKNKDEITTRRLQKLQEYFKHISDNQTQCDVNTLIIANLSFNGNSCPARMCDLFAYYGEFNLIEYLVKFHSAEIDQRVMDCAIFGGDPHTIQFLQNKQPELVSDYSLFELPVMADSIDKVISKLDLSGYLQLRRVKKRFSLYREALVDQLILQLQSSASFDRLKALRGLISITRHLSDEVKRNLAERVNKINFDRIIKKSFHLEVDPEKIITYDNKAQLLTEYLNLPSDDEIPDEPQPDERCFVYTNIEKHLYMKLLHQLGCVFKYHEVFYDDIDRWGDAVADKFRLTLLSMNDRDESDQAKSAVVFNQSEIIKLQQEIQKRLYSNHYANDDSGIEQQQSDIHTLMTILSNNVNDKYDKTYLINFIEYFIKILSEANKLPSVNFHFVQLPYLLTLISNEELLTIVWPKFEEILMFSLNAWPFAQVENLDKEQNEERNINYAHDLIRVFFDIFLPKLSMLQIQQLIAKTDCFAQEPDCESLHHYLSVALMVYWNPENDTPEKLTTLAKKIFNILKFYKETNYEEPFIISDLLLHVIFYRLSLKNRLNKLLPYLLNCLDDSSANIEISLQMINLIIKYSTKTNRSSYFTVREQSANPFIVTFYKYFEYAKEAIEGWGSADIVDDIRFENQYLFDSLPSNVLADEALYCLWNKIFELRDLEFHIEKATLLAKFGLRFPTYTVINFLADKIDSIFPRLRDIFNYFVYDPTLYSILFIIDMILDRLNKDEVNHQQFINLIERLVEEALSLGEGLFKLTVIARLYPFSSRMQDYISKYATSLFTQWSNMPDNTFSDIANIRDVINSLAILSPCLTGSDHVLLKVACRLKQVGVQNLSSDIYKFDPDSFLTQFYTLLSANLSTQSRANLFHLVYELFLNVIERFAKDVRNDTYNHYNYNNILYLFLNLFDHSNDINYFKNYLLPVLSKIFEHLGDDLIDYLYSKLLDSKFNHNDKKTGYHLLFVMNEFHQLLHDLLASKKSRSINQLLFCFMLMDFDKQRCTEILGLKEGDLAVDILEIFARNHASLISNSMLTQQSTHCKSAAAADVTMQDETPSAAMLLDSGNSIFSVSNKRSAINEDEKDKKIQRTNSPHSPR